MNGALGYVGSFTRKLVGSDASSLLTKTIGKGLAGTVSQFEDMGRDALLSLVGGSSSPIGMALNAGFRYINLESREAQRAQKRNDKPLSAKQQILQKLKHQEWLNDNRWRFDWRSQPRRPAGSEAGGEWMEGRLDYQAETKKAFSRSVIRRRTRSMRQYKARQKAMGNNTTRTIRSAWGDF